VKEADGTFVVMCPRCANRLTNEHAATIGGWAIYAEGERYWYADDVAAAKAIETECPGTIDPSLLKTTEERWEEEKEARRQ
jgi:hypothetical protein